jgi:hypothetical protein
MTLQPATLNLQATATAIATRVTFPYTIFIFIFTEMQRWKTTLRALVDVRLA